jgi:2,4-dienoyl-CoA reductase-like NADH-dependent reductase (Old Yellow Enzyme family)
MAEYYRQRASAGLIVAEATAVTPQGVGYADTPGIWSQDQVEGWRQVTDTVHDAGGRIVLQLWHVGRISHPDFLRGELPVAPSAIAPEGEVRVPGGKKPYVTPRALELHEIPGIVEAYRNGAENALAAGFDGVEIHGAHGYLLDAFLRDGSNHRTDEYGGPIENRARLILEVTDAVLEVWGRYRTGLRISPQYDGHSMSDSNPGATFGYLARELGQRGLAFLHIREPIDGEQWYTPELKRQFQENGGGAVIVNDGLDRAKAEKLLESGNADLVAFGIPFISNPDLVRRLELNAPLNEPDLSTFYAPGPKGYIDYPVLR